MQRLNTGGWGQDGRQETSEKVNFSRVALCATISTIRDYSKGRGKSKKQQLGHKKQVSTTPSEMRVLQLG